MAQKLERRCEKKPLFCLKFSPKNLYFTKNSLLKRPLFSKEPARGLFDGVEVVNINNLYMMSLIFTCSQLPISQSRSSSHTPDISK